MATPRPYWTGHLRLSLVVVPVRLYAAVSGHEKIRFHKIYKPTGERIHYQNVTESEGPVDKADIVKGYEYEKGRYVTVEDEELERLRLEWTRILDLVQFAKAGDIPVLYCEKPYFVAPDGKAALEAYSVTRDALRRTGTVVVGQIVLARREHIGALLSCGKGLVLETLRYRYEVHNAEPYFADLPTKEADPQSLELAEQVIRQKPRPFDPGKLHDHCEEALRELVQAKLRHRKLPQVAEPRPTAKVIGLVSALKRSLGEEKPRKAGRRGRARQAKTRRTATRRGKARKAA